jgi:carbohydrate-selective porin OprB
MVFRAAGFGATAVRPVSGRRETICEAFYKWRPLEKIFVQPDLQWIANADGGAAHHLVGGLRVGVEW